MSDIRDGASNTIIFVETIEPRFARWTVGAEVTLVGLPSNLEYGLVKDGGLDCFAPRDSTPTMRRTARPRDPDYHTYLNWDYEKKPYDGGDGTKGGKYGPEQPSPGRRESRLPRRQRTEH